MVPLLSILCCLSLVSAAQAEIIIDDFDDTAILSGPITNDDPRVQTFGVGELNATRAISVFAGRGIVEGQINSNATDRSHLTATMVGITPLTLNDTPLVAMGIEYTFPGGFDLSENGQNTVLLLDFKSLSGLTPPPFIRFWLFDDTIPGLSYVRFLLPVPTSSDPFTMVVPFETLRDRGGGSIPATFENAYGLSISFQANEYFGEPEELGWNVVIDRIRVGTVPEPNAVVLLMVGLFMLPRRFP